MTLEGHELGRVFRHAGTKGRRDHAFASCECGMTFVGRNDAVVRSRHLEHLERLHELGELKPHRTDPRWVRLREACCGIVGSGFGDGLDEYVDVVYFRLIPGTTTTRAAGAAHLGGGSATPAAGR